MDCCYKWQKFKEFQMYWVIKKDNQLIEIATETIRRDRIKYCPECGIVLKRKRRRLYDRP